MILESLCEPTSKSKSDNKGIKCLYLSLVWFFVAGNVPIILTIETFSIQDCWEQWNYFGKEM